MRFERIERQRGRQGSRSEGKAGQNRWRESRMTEEMAVQDSSTKDRVVQYRVEVTSSVR
jgi:hypothetical protein